MSGSMGGSPVKNAVKLVYLFNQLARKVMLKCQCCIQQQTLTID